ncbi:hypothetical protein [Actinobacillus pleuropneumoniae]|uniref:hypothetical protein n=1 Tax=Actinobacillus pleuropneumoniae TaxID=715 RepID=UPI001F242358|nr:hypothetical protein [Actinobacillus pleuropneumoniae]
MEKKLKHKFDLLSAYGRTEDGVEESHRIELCSIAMNTLIYLPDKSILPYSFEKFGQSLEEYLNNDSNLTDDVSYLICASFLKEYYLYKTKIDTDTNDIESSDVYKIWHDFKELTIPISENNPIFNDEFYRELKRDDTFLDSIYFCLSIKNNELEKKRTSYLDELNTKFSNLNRKLDENKQSLDAAMEVFSHKVEKSYSNVEILSKKLEEQETAFNFVGLYDGFNNLSKIKNEQKRNTYRFSIALGILLFLLPLISILCPNTIGLAKDVEFESNLLRVLPMLGLELILLYFFRIVLNRLHTLQTEIVQIELRKALCQFIQNYAKYAKEIRVLEDNKEVNILDKFENIIFSNILSNSDKVPSTFDGLEQLSNLIKEFKK